MSTEIWREILGYDGCYEVSNFGRVRSWKVVGSNTKRNKTARIMNQHKNNKGYSCVGLRGKRKATRLVHVLVIESFLRPRPTKKYDADHIDEDHSNNRADNLQWLTHRENNAKSHARRRLLPTGVRQSSSRFSAGIRFKGKTISLGTFSTVIEAGNAYKLAASQIAGNYFVPFSRDLPTGVSKKRGRFLAQVQINKKYSYLGVFDTQEEASEAYQLAKSKA